MIYKTYNSTDNSEINELIQNAKEMFNENIRLVSGKKITHNTAANTGYHTDEDTQKYFGADVSKEGYTNADDGEKTEAQRINAADSKVIDAGDAVKGFAYRRQEHDERTGNGNKGVDRVAESGGWGDAQNNIPQDTAAHSGGHAQYGYAQNIHFLFNGYQCAGNGKSNGADQFQNEKHGV